MAGWSFRVWFIIIGAVALLGYLAYLGHSIYSAGADHTALKQADAQLNQNQKTATKHAKIIHSVPFDADRVPSIKWMQQYTRAGQ